MSPTELRRQAHHLRTEADRLQRLAVAIEAEHRGLTRAYAGVWPLFEPTTWQGPAADRAYDGAQQARADARRAFELAAGHALQVRWEARDLRTRADALDARARAQEAAIAAARAAEAAARMVGQQAVTPAWLRPPSLGSHSSA